MVAFELQSKLGDFNNINNQQPPYLVVREIACLAVVGTIDSGGEHHSMLVSSGISDEVLELFEQELPPEYREEVIARYEETRKMVSKSELPEQYQLPDLEEFSDLIIASVPAYLAMVNLSEDDKGWTPKALFYPELTSEEWKVLLSGHEFRTKRDKPVTSNGIKFPFAKDHEVSKPTDQTSPNFPARKIKWNIATVNGADNLQPINGHVSRPGDLRYAIVHNEINEAIREEAIRELKYLGEACGSLTREELARMSEEEVVQSFNATLDMTLAYFLNCMAEGKSGTDNWVAIKDETITVDGTEYTGPFYAKISYDQVVVRTMNLTQGTGLAGLRYYRPVIEYKRPTK